MGADGTTSYSSNPRLGYTTYKGGRGGGGIGEGPWYISGGGGRGGRKNSDVQSSHSGGYAEGFSQADVGTFSNSGVGESPASDMIWVTDGRMIPS